MFSPFKVLIDKKSKAEKDSYAQKEQCEFFILFPEWLLSTLQLLYCLSGG